MKHLDQYTISFSGLAIGHHEFIFEVDEKFFSCFEGSEISSGAMQVRIDLEKSSTMLELHFHLQGIVRVSCDLCTGDFDLPVEGAEKLIVKFGEEEFENTDDIIILPHGEHQINIAQPLYEFINLSLPARRVHPEGECDQEMLIKIEEYRARDKESGEETDPRWDMLKNIKLN